MNDLDLLLKALTGKDEIKAQNAADYLINNTDLDLFKLLVDKTDFLFPFVRNNVLKRIEKAVNESNFKNIIKFFDCYSNYYDDLFALILAKHANEDLTDIIFEFLESGTIAQKTYAAKYFSYIPDTVALEDLNKYAFCDDENLSANAAEALGQMQDDVSFDIALNNLESDDDFEKLKAVKFFCSYGKNYPLKEIFDAVKNSKMPENIAGQIPYMESLLELLNTEYKSDTLICIYYIIFGLGEILPLSDIFQFELKELLKQLIQINLKENEFSPQAAVILLSAFSKFKMFNENEEYIFDEDKDTKSEIISIYQILNNQSEGFWNKQKNFVLGLLKLTDKDILKSLPVISEFNITNAIDDLKKLLSSDNEIIICEVLNTLKSLNALNGTDINSILEKIKNQNIKILIENSIYPVM